MKIAVITGASSGLGWEYALRAGRFFDIEEIWAIARRRDKLEALAGKIEGVRVRPVVLDLSNPAAFAAYSDLLAGEKPDVRLFVNCAGLGQLGDFDKIGADRDMAACDLNVRAFTVLSGLTAPYMSRGAAMIAACSIAAFAPTPRMSVYSATKAYVDAYSKGIREELKPRGVTVTVVYPCPMETEFLGIAGIPGNSPAFARLPRCSAAKVAEVTLKKAARGGRAYTPHIYKAYRVLCKLLPAGLIMKFSKV
jgi:short-subunit dehydrogenase